MLKLRNAVLTALLAFCLAMPFVSCSFNDGATGDVSDKVTVQSDNNQNGGNENPSGSDNGGNGHEHPSGGDNGGNENPSGGNNGGSGNENPSGGNEKPVEGTMYTVMYNGQPLVDENGEVVKIPAAALDYYKTILSEGDYTINGNVITLTDSGLKKVQAAGEGGGHGGIPPVTDGPVPDVPGDVEGTVYTVKYGDIVIASNMSESALSVFAQTYGLVEDTDYTIDGNVITLTESGFKKVRDAGAGEGGGQELGTGESGSGEVTEYIVKYNGRVLDTIPAADLEYYQTILLPEDYTISGNVITLTDSGFEKGKAAGFGK
ncbi:hypothetical protein [Treponema porcinum]|uniref:hypothetical protein n=1 Tax=Treponema porcinum TaxID=261392 RepID=UPI002A7FD9EC|nr:hypothetical protein [Treponema porcinum]MDY4467828.1 hypothetical protein [Treponema porcinum]